MLWHDEMTVGEALHWMEDAFAEVGMGSPVADAQWLLATAMGWGRLEAFLHLRERLTPEQSERLKEMAERRIAREPLQLILGAVQFRGLELEMERGVLIPRPETEIVVDAAINLWQQTGAGLPTLGLDLGTGSGCIALALAQEIPALHMIGTDLSLQAILLARRNRHRNQLGGKVDFMVGDWLRPIALRHQFGLVIANPPYIRSEEMEKLAVEVRAYDPELALHGGYDGCEVYRTIIPTASGVLAPGGILCLECGDGRVDEIYRMMADAGFVDLDKAKDLCGCWRVAWGYWPRKLGDD
jgi:release factor glutamine methyltransferase